MVTNSQEIGTAGLFRPYLITGHPPLSHESL